MIFSNEQVSEFAYSLYQIGALKLGKFTLKSGDISPYYIDLRLIPSFPDVFQSTVEFYSTVLNQLNYKPVAIAGIMSAGIPFATALCIKHKIPLLQIRSGSKSYGTKKMIEGELNDKSGKVLLLDDLIATGASKIPALQVLRSEGYTANDLLILIDRTSNEKSKQIFLENQLNINFAFTIDELLQTLTEHKKMDQTVVNDLKKAISNWKSN